MGARVGKYKLGARAGKYKLWAGSQGQGQGWGPRKGPEAGKYKFPSKYDFEYVILSILNLYV